MKLTLLPLVLMAAYALQAQHPVPRVTIDPAIQQHHPKDSVVMIITFTNPADAADARKTMAQNHARLVGPEFKHLPIQGLKAAVSDLQWLTKLKGAFGVWKNQPLKNDMHQAVIVSRVNKVWEDNAFISLNNGLPITGRGVGVLVNDSGFDGDSTDIQEGESPRGPRRIVQNVKGASADWIENFAADNGLIRDSDQTGGHGSHCMGIVGGDGRYSNGKYKGVAPGAYLIGYGSGAGINILDVAGGFEYVAKHGRDYNIRVMSNSFGSTSDTTFTSFDPSNPYAVATKALIDRGVIVVFSAGNSGPAAGTVTGNFKTAPWVVMVANGQKDGSLASSSSRGRFQSSASDDEAQQATVNVDGKNYLWENRPSVTAPGTDIVSVRATTATTPIVGLTIPDELAGLSMQELPYYSILSGTSMACPHVAGVVALMLEANPALEWRAVKAILQRTAVPLTTKKWESGFGYINAHAAVAAAYFGLMNTTSTDYHDKYGLPADSSFGFVTDPWRNDPLHPEVLARMHTTIPTVEEVQPECTMSSPPLKDSTGAADINPTNTNNVLLPYYDIKEVRLHDETAVDFKISLEVAGNLAVAPPGISGVLQHYYDVHFTLDKIGDNNPPTPNVAYIVSAFDEAGTKNYKLTVRSNDGTTRPVTNATHYENITGTWNTTTNTITWTVPKAKLNVAEAPASTSTAAPRTSRPAQAGDILKNWLAFTYERALVATPDGPGVYNDKAVGQCFKTLQQ